MKHFNKWLVVSDLDGSLLSHDDYAYDKALPALQQLTQLQVPVVFNTSKTYAETMVIRQQLQNQDAFVVENGSAVYIPDAITYSSGYRKLELGMPLENIRSLLAAALLETDEFVALTDLGLSEITALTGLDAEQARSAASRDFSMPVMWLADPAQREDFVRRVRRTGLQVLQGGRFMHLQGQTDKAMALEALRHVYPDHGIAAIGDSGNDLAMLQAADLAIVISSPGNVHLPHAFHADYKSRAAAPAGWAEAIAFLLQRWGIN